MIERFGPLRSVEHLGRAGWPAHPTTRQARPVEHLLDPFPPAPPPEVLKALDRAQRVIADLQAMQVNLRFSVEPGSRFHVEVVDADGDLIRELPVGKALDVLYGDDAAGLLIDATG